jgi:hypothetical protein
MAMSQILVPAEQWETMASANSCQIAAEQQCACEGSGHKPVPVRTAEYGGYLYTAFATIYGPYGAARKPCVEAYRLLPRSMYSGETTSVYHDAEAIRSGLRERGDHTGLIVSVRGNKMVCADKVWFLMDLPGTRPLSQAEAESYDEWQRDYGWRAGWFNGALPEWFSLNRHPVARYRGHATIGNNRAALFWKLGGAIQELSIADDVALFAPERRAVAVGEPEGQLALF